MTVPDGHGGSARRVAAGVSDTDQVDRVLDAGRSVTIGEVITLLRPEFPDVTISKIRFLEDQGLVEPDRSPSGYRKFTRSHVDLLRTVLVLQRDHYLPLRVIREVVGSQRPSLAVVPDESAGTSPAAGARPTTRTATVPPAAAAPADGAVRGTGRHDEDWLARTADVDRGLVADLVDQGLVQRGRDGRYDVDDVETVRAASVLAGHGLGPRHLRLLRTAADREADLVRGVVAPLAASRGGQERAADVRREVAAALLRLHTAMLACRLR